MLSYGKAHLVDATKQRLSDPKRRSLAELPYQALHVGNSHNGCRMFTLLVWYPSRPR